MWNEFSICGFTYITYDFQHDFTPMSMLMVQLDF